MSKKSILLWLWYCFFLPLHAQVTEDKQPLTNILNTLQDTFDCTFSYRDKELNTISIPMPNLQDSLVSILSFLEQRTPFQYIFITSKDILIRPKKGIKEYTICGTLLTTDRNKTIENATLIIGSQITTSDTNGFFQLQVNTENPILTIQCLGYEKRSIPIAKLLTSKCQDITLNSAIEGLSEVILNTYITQGISKKTDGSIAIDYTNFGLIPGLIEPDLLQTIQALPGILSAEEKVSDINVRGGTRDQNLILWDGIKMYQSGHFFGLISAFNPYLTKNIQLYKNGSPAHYGDGVSSVIAMRTSDALQKQTEISLGANLISVDGYVDTPIGKRSSIQFAVRKSINEWVETPVYKQYFDKAFQNSEVTTVENSELNSDRTLSFYDISTRWLYHISDKDLIKVNGLLMRNQLIFQENATLNQITSSRESSAKQHNTAGSILYQRQWSPKFKSDLLWYGTNYALTATNADILNNQRLLQENTVLETGAHLTTDWTISNRYKLVSGYQFTETGITNVRDVTNPIFRDAIKEVIRTHGLFSGITYASTNDALHFSFGLRANYFNKFETYRIEPRLSIQYKFWNHFTLETLAEQKSQVTSQVVDFQDDFLGVENRRWVLSNASDIPILQSAQVSQGLSYLQNNWRISADVYYKNVTGIITRSQGFQNQYEFAQDHGEYNVKGIDFLLSKRFKKISTWFSYSYAENEYTFSNLPDVNFPNNIDIQHNINTAITYTSKKLKISTGLHWHSGKPTTRPASLLVSNNEISYKPANSDRLQDYFRIDISGTYTFPISKKINGFAGVSLWNVLHQKNDINSYYQINDGNQIENSKQLGLGLTPNAVFRLSF